MRWIALCLSLNEASRPTEPDADKHTELSRAQHDLQLSFERFTPMVNLHAETHCKGHLGVLLEVSGCFRLFGGEDQIMQTIYQCAKQWTQQHPQVNLKLAAYPTAQAAWWLAKCGAVQSLVAFQDAPNWTEQALETLPVGVLDLSAQHKRLMDQCGLQQLRDLQCVPRDGLQRRFGVALQQELDQGFGQQTQWLTPYEPPPVFSADQELPFHATAQARIVAVMEQLLMQLQHWLKARQMGSNTLEWTFRQLHKQRELITRSSRLLQTQADWLELIEHQLHALKFDDDVHHVELRCSQLEPFSQPSDTLLIERDPVDPQHWKRVCDQLRSRLGDQTVLAPTIHADPRPEHGFSYAPIPLHTERQRTRSQNKPKKKQQNQHQLTPQHERPAWLLQQPLALKGEHQGWQILTGPELIEFAWWSPSACRRNYYKAANVEQVQAWIFQDLDAPAPQTGWYLHGYFS